MNPIIQADRQLFQLLNGQGPPWLDPWMTTLSSIWVWIPLVAYLLYAIVTNNKWKTSLFFLLTLLLTYLLTEQLSVQVFKDGVQRLRPCHEPTLSETIRLVAKRCGGQYGFVSTHASNAFGLITTGALILKNRWFTLCGLLWAIAVSYSRIHLGVHYPGDVLGGMILGSLTGFSIFVLAKKTGNLLIQHGQED